MKRQRRQCTLWLDVFKEYQLARIVEDPSLGEGHVLSTLCCVNKSLRDEAYGCRGRIESVERVGAEIANERMEEHPPKDRSDYPSWILYKVCIAYRNHKESIYWWKGGHYGETFGYDLTNIICVARSTRHNDEETAKKILVSVGCMIPSNESLNRYLFQRCGVLLDIVDALFPKINKVEVDFELINNETTHLLRVAQRAADIKFFKRCSHDERVLLRSLNFPRLKTLLLDDDRVRNLILGKKSYPLLERLVLHDYPKGVSQLFSHPIRSLVIDCGYNYTVKYATETLRHPLLPKHGLSKLEQLTVSLIDDDDDEDSIVDGIPELLQQVSLTAPNVEELCLDIPGNSILSSYIESPLGGVRTLKIRYLQPDFFTSDRLTLLEKACRVLKEIVLMTPRIGMEEYEQMTDAIGYVIPELEFYVEYELDEDDDTVSLPRVKALWDLVRKKLESSNKD